MSDFYISSGEHEVTVAPGNIAKSENVVDRAMDDSAHAIDDIEEDNMNIDSHISSDLHNKNEDFLHHNDTVVATNVHDIPLELPHVSA